jgi:ATP-dependent Clp protease protease subunit
MIRMEDDKAPPPEPVGAMLEKAIFKSRTILLTGAIDDKQAHRVCQSLLAFEAESDEPIRLILSSPGGHVESGDMIHDMIGWVRPKVRILGTGWVASAGALIYCAVPREDRFCTPNTRFLLHEPRGGVGGQASDVEIQVREILTMRARLNRIFAAATGQPFEKIVEDTDRDLWMQADEAVGYGLVGKIVRNAGEMG